MVRTLEELKARAEAASELQQLYHALAELDHTSEFADHIYSYLTLRREGNQNPEFDKDIIDMIPLIPQIREIARVIKKTAQHSPFPPPVFWNTLEGPPPDVPSDARWVSFNLMQQEYRDYLKQTHALFQTKAAKLLEESYTQPTDHK